MSDKAELITNTSGHYERSDTVRANVYLYTLIVHTRICGICFITFSPVELSKSMFCGMDDVLWLILVLWHVLSRNPPGATLAKNKMAAGRLCH